MLNKAKIQNWFETWFNSPYYHMLYKNRDNSEAQLFITNLLSNLSPDKNSKILDLACGKGRHSVFLNKNGYNVTGTDLSEESIKWAKQFETKDLKFFVKDMREAFKNKKFDLILNLFTSFGYFDSNIENLKVLKAANQMLNDNGALVIDFLNVHLVKKNIVAHEKVKRNEVVFKIKREIRNGQIQKSIRFTDNNKEFNFTEYVQALELSDFNTLLAKANMRIENIFGNYNMDEFNPDTSDRLILICRKL